MTVDNAAPKQANPDLIATYELVRDLIYARSYDDPNVGSRDWDAYIATSAMERSDVTLLSLFAEHLFSGCQYSLDDVMGAYKAFNYCRVASPYESVTEKAAYIYRMLLNVTSDASEQRNSVNTRSVLCAAMLHGETTDAAIGMMESIIRDRMPVNGDEFVSILEQVRSTSSPSLSSGVL